MLRMASYSNTYKCQCSPPCMQTSPNHVLQAHHHCIQCCPRQLWLIKRNTNKLEHVFFFSPRAKWEYLWRYGDKSGYGRQHLKNERGIEIFETNAHSHTISIHRGRQNQQEINVLCSCFKHPFVLWRKWARHDEHHYALAQTYTSAPPAFWKHQEYHGADQNTGKHTRKLVLPCGSMSTPSAAVVCAKASTKTQRTELVLLQMFPQHYLSEKQ